MTQKLQPVRGTHDFFPDDMRRFRCVVDTARAAAECYGFGEIATPMFEFTEVFQRTLGDTSDVVTKETYSFTDRGGENITLRPEFTAAIARAFISHGLKDELPLKYFYAGPAFRYERPQKGRMRQFHQVGAELLGVAEPLADIEMIALAQQTLHALGLTKLTRLELNSLGDAESRRAYRAALVGYFEDHRAQLSEESKQRLTKNPLRILDSKDEGDRKINDNAPSMQAHFTAEAQDFFGKVQEGLAALGISFYLNPRLVRGLDYYNHTVFEFTTEALGSQNTVLAGGRYDQLIEIMGGPATPGIGWAAGIERLTALVDFAAHPGMPRARRPVVIVPMGEVAEKQALATGQALRAQGFYVELGYRGNLSKRMKRADKQAASVVLLMGEEELARGEATVKDLDSGTQMSCKLDALAAQLAPYRERVKNEG